MKKLTQVALAAVLGLAIAAQSVQAQGSGRDNQFQTSQEERHNMETFVNPLPATADVFMEDLTELEVRDAIKAGKTNVLVLTGSIEHNGPYMTTGKHNNVLHVSG